VCLCISILERVNYIKKIIRQRYEQDRDIVNHVKPTLKHTHTNAHAYTHSCVVGFHPAAVSTAQ
jgi:hypothetical protein